MSNNEQLVFYCLNFFVSKMQAKTTTISSNPLAIGKGIFPFPDVVKVLDMPYRKVYAWMRRYWKGELGETFKSNYVWEVNGSRGVNFLTLVELHTMMHLADSGVRTQEVLEVRETLSVLYGTPTPFAHKAVLEGMYTKGNEVFWKTKNDTITLTGKKPFQSDAISLLIEKLDFNEDSLASKYYPIGKEKPIVIDPRRQFGSPVLINNNIYPQTLYYLYKGGEPKDFIARLYRIKLEEVEAAIEYCQTQ